jgi:TPR repeat protein
MKYVFTLALLPLGLSGFAQTQKKAPVHRPQTQKAAVPVSPEVAKEQSSAAKGDTAAMYKLGMRYYNGTDVKQNYLTASQWLNKAAAKGHTGAMLQLGMMYTEGGPGIKQNLPQALIWVRKAADKGNADAMNVLAEMYEDGAGVKENKQEAVKYYRLAAEKGHLDAMTSLAFSYIDGEGAPQNKQEGLSWLQKAADKRHPVAMRYMGDYYGDPEMGNDCSKALEWYMRASEKGDTVSVNAAGEICLEGKCADVDMTRVIEWLRTNCDNEVGDACYFMARLYISGKNVDQSYSKAMDFFIKDAESKMRKGIARSNSMRNLFVLYNLGKLSQTRQQRLLDWLEAAANKTSDADIMAGMGYIYTNKENATKRDYITALDWSTRSAEKGNATGCYNVGYLYANGLGVKADQKTAFDWMLKAANKGDKAAMAILSDFYENGEGVMRNPQKAAEWKKKAAASEKED